MTENEAWLTEIMAENTAISSDMVSFVNLFKILPAGFILKKCKGAFKSPSMAFSWMVKLAAREQNAPNTKSATIVTCQYFTSGQNQTSTSNRIPYQIELVGFFQLFG